LGRLFFVPCFQNKLLSISSYFSCCRILLFILPSGSAFFNYLARESDVKAGKLISMIQLFLTTAILLLIGSMTGTDKFPLFIIGSAFAITTFGDGIADIINILEKEKKQIVDNKIFNSKVYSAKSSIVFPDIREFLCFYFRCLDICFAMEVPVGMIIFLSVIGALTGALLESMTQNEDNIIIPFGSAMVMWLFYMFGFNVDTVYLLKVLAFSFLLGYLSFRVRIADISAMLSATLMGLLLSSQVISTGFFILLAFFMLGSMFTRYKYTFKLVHGTAEGKSGVRGYKNVLVIHLLPLSLQWHTEFFHPMRRY